MLFPLVFVKPAQDLVGPYLVTILMVALVVRIAMLYLQKPAIILKKILILMFFVVFT